MNDRQISLPLKGKAEGRSVVNVSIGIESSGKAIAVSTTTEVVATSMVDSFLSWIPPLLREQFLPTFLWLNPTRMQQKGVTVHCTPLVPPRHQVEPNIYTGKFFLYISLFKKGWNA